MTSGIGARTVHRRFEEQAERSPESVAVTCGATAVTYARLNAAANRISRYLRSLGVRPGDRVGLRLHRSPEAVATMLAVAKAGASYVPLEPHLPERRMRSMVEQAAPRVILLGPQLRWEHPGFRAVVVPDLLEGSAENLGLSVDTDDELFLSYTSGSTGEPKGIEIPHRAVPGFFEEVREAGWGPRAVSLFHSSMSWDAHLLDVYPALLTGGRVEVFPGDTIDPLAVARYAYEHGVTGFFLPAQAFNVVVDEAPFLLSRLQWLMTGGEVASHPHFQRAVQACPELRLINIYGPVESAVLCTVHQFSHSDLGRATVPIGRPAGDRQVHVLEDPPGPAAEAASGELCVAGPGVARGYLGRPRLTAERFVPDPHGSEPGARMYRTGDRALRRDDGALEFLGRRDRQVKLRGFRLELDEIEALLRAHPNVVNAAVELDREGPGGGRLLAYIVPSGSGIDPDEVGSYLAGRLPGAAVPSAYVSLDRLPVTRNGKIDRRLLPRPAPRQHAAVDAAPWSGIERAVARVWERLLRVPSVSRNDDFFALGGSSVVAARVTAQLQRELGIRTDIRDLYRARTLERFAAILNRSRDAQVPDTPPLRRISRELYRQARRSRAGSGAEPNDEGAHQR
ncbi:non-ribosomal peptide synthetase [Streptomyces sp. NPDC023998]|uniref:non-ribosomal peptide synthetase n=1 Tax=Streptomyces sp. NPDC023998 TaxID=3154597 RepID=UPI0033DF6B6A